MKTDICRFSGNADLLYDITECLRNRKLNQKYAYIGEGGTTYYNYNSFFSGVEVGSCSEVDIWKNLLKKYINTETARDKRTNFIGVACGNSSTEKNIINSLGVSNINYIGIDNSEDMIELSMQNLKDEKFESSLILSDITDIAFKRYLDSFVRRDERRFFSFLGTTFGNIKTTNVVDLLGAYLQKGDLLGMDATLVQNMGVQSSVTLFNHYKEKTLNNQRWRNYILGGFNYINFPVEKGDIIIEIEENKNMGSYRVIFSLEMLENLEFHLEGPIILSKGEKIEFFEVYFYEPVQLVKFMNTHHFKLLESNIDDRSGRFLFEKE